MIAHSFFSTGPSIDLLGFRNIADSNGLTPTQCAILDLLCAGHTNRQIATQLGMTPDGVKYHLKVLFKILKVRGRAHAVATVYQAGLMSQLPAHSFGPDQVRLDIRLPATSRYDSSRLGVTLTSDTRSLNGPPRGPANPQEEVP